MTRGPILPNGRYISPAAGGARATLAECSREQSTRVPLAARVCCAALFLSTVLGPARAASSYQQTYLILMKGVPSGTETVAEDFEGENLVAKTSSEIFISDSIDTKRMAFVTRMVLSKLYAPISYSYRYTSGPGDGYEVKVQGAQVTRVLTRNGRSSEAVAPLAPGAVILDFSVYHQFDYVVRKYDFKKGGRQ